MYVAREAEGGTGSARRRRERRLRSMLRHERMAVAMALAEALHHSSGLKVMERAQHAALRGQKSGARAGVAGPAPVTEYLAPALAVAPFSSPAVTFVAPAPVVGYETPAPGRLLCSACSRGWFCCACTCRHLCSACSRGWFCCACTCRHLCSACSCDWLRCARTFRHLCNACSSDRLRCARTFRHLCIASSGVRVRCARSCVRVHRTCTCCVCCCAQPTVTSCFHRRFRHFLASTLTPSLWFLRHRSLVHFLTVKCVLRPCFTKFIMYRLLEVIFPRTWSKSLLSSRGGHHLSSM